MTEAVRSSTGLARSQALELELCKATPMTAAR